MEKTNEYSKLVDKMNGRIGKKVYVKSLSVISTVVNYTIQYKEDYAYEVYYYVNIGKTNRLIHENDTIILLMDTYRND